MKHDLTVTVVHIEDILKRSVAQMSLCFVLVLHHLQILGPRSTAGGLIISVA